MEEEEQQNRRRSSQFAGRRSYLDLTQLQRPQEPQGVRRRSIDDAVKCAAAWGLTLHSLVWDSGKSQ